MTTKKTTYWTKKKLFTVRFKGRKPRALLWRKAVYREWFEYAKIAQNQNSNSVPDFGNLQNFDKFEDWWRDRNYGFELFCEPYMDNVATILNEAPERIDPDHILLNINLNADRDKIIQIITKLLKQNQVSDEYQSLARFQPSLEMKYLKPEKLKKFRKTWLLIETGISHKEVVNKLNLIPDHLIPDKSEHRKYALKSEETLEKEATYERLMLSALRKVSRHKRAVNQILDNIEKGTFP